MTDLSNVVIIVHLASTVLSQLGAKIGSPNVEIVIFRRSTNFLAPNGREFREKLAKYVVEDLDTFQKQFSKRDYLEPWRRYDRKTI